jgi:hypothetical protein
METKLTGVNLTDLASQKGSLLATIKGIYEDDPTLAGFRIVASFTVPKGAGEKKTLELILIFQK